MMYSVFLKIFVNNEITVQFRMQIAWGKKEKEQILLIGAEGALCNL